MLKARTILSKICTFMHTETDLSKLCGLYASDKNKFIRIMWVYVKEEQLYENYLNVCITQEQIHYNLVGLC